MIPHDALDQRAFARAVFPNQSVKGSRRNFERNIVVGHEGAKTLGHVDQFDVEWLVVALRRRLIHAMALMNSRETATAPKTPPCILTMLIAARWLPASVAPVQSDKSKHSNPRSLASRMVVWTQTS